MDLQSPTLTKVINDRLEREYTVEDLEEWTEYELQIQAFNAIGAGPWSEVVRGRTRESGKSKLHVCSEGRIRELQHFSALLFILFVSLLFFFFLFGLWVVGGFFAC